MEKTILSSYTYIYIVYENRTSEDGTDSEVKDVRVFVDTGANVNTMSIRQFLAFMNANIDQDYIEGPFGGFRSLRKNPAGSW